MQNFKDLLPMIFLIFFIVYASMRDWESEDSLGFSWRILLIFGIGLKFFLQNVAYLIM